MNIGRSLAYLSTALLFVPISTLADTVNLGVLSLDTFIPGDQTPGTDAFDIANFTGSFSLAPDFPVANDVTLIDASLTITLSDSSQLSYSVSTISPGILVDASGNPVVQVPNNLAFAKAEFTAILSTTLLTLPDGTVIQADSPSLDVTLVPSGGAFLVPDVDQVLLSVPGSRPSSVLEPTTGVLTVIGFCILEICLKRKESL